MRKEILFLLSCSIVSADPIVYSNFGPDNSFDTNTALLVGLSSAELFHNALASSFQPAITTNLASIDVALRGPADNLWVDISLNQDSSGLPGSTLELFPLFVQNDVPPAIYQVNFQANPVLLAGQTYWVVVAIDPRSAFTGLGWNLNSIGASGHSAFQVNSGGPWAPVSSGPDVAFSVESTPEPSTVLLVCLGLCGVLGGVRRGRAAAAGTPAEHPIVKNARGESGEPRESCQLGCAQPALASPFRTLIINGK
jgi:hypothetical protein